MARQVLVGQPMVWPAKLDRSWQEEVPAAADETKHVTLQRQKQVYGTLLCNGTDILKDVSLPGRTTAMVHGTWRIKSSLVTWLAGAWVRGKRPGNQKPSRQAGTPTKCHSRHATEVPEHPPS